MKMPRLLLTDAEAELIRRDREVRTMQAVAYNQAIDDILAMSWSGELTFASAEQYKADCLALKRPVPSR